MPMGHSFIHPSSFTSSCLLDSNYAGTLAVLLTCYYGPASKSLPFPLSGIPFLQIAFSAHILIFLKGLPEVSILNGSLNPTTSLPCFISFHSIYHNLTYYIFIVYAFIDCILLPPTTIRMLSTAKAGILSVLFTNTFPGPRTIPAHS